MQVVIVEDELVSSRRLERMLADLNCEVLASIVSVKSTIKWLQTHKHPEILFLDIQLSDGLCFEIFDEVKVESAIIFTTAFSNYSLKAFEYKSISYLLKPINKEQLQKAILKTNTFLINNDEISDFKEHITNKQNSSYKDNFTVKVGNKIRIVDVKDISCFYSLDNASYLHVEGSNYIINYSLLSLNDILNPNRFFQVSRKCIINKQKLESCNRIKVNRFKIEMENFNEFEIFVSRERIKAFKDWLDN